MMNLCNTVVRPLFIALFVVANTSFFVVDGFSMSSSSSSNIGKTIYGIPNSGWTSSQWNWGYASGTGHDCALICRRKYASQEERSKLIDELLTTPTMIDFEEVKLVMALAWQNGRWDGSDGGVGGYGDVLAMMADARRYEEEITDKSSPSPKLLLLRDMRKRFNLLDPTDDDRIAMESLKDDDNEGDVDKALRSCSGLVLKAMGFVSNGM